VRATPYARKSDAAGCRPNGSSIGDAENNPGKSSCSRRPSSSHLRKWQAAPRGRFDRIGRAVATPAAEPVRFASDGYSFLVEMLVTAAAKGCRIGEVPIRFVERRRGASKMSSSVIFESILMPWQVVLGAGPAANRRLRAISGGSR
jgi:hypothetical protein